MRKMPEREYTAADFQRYYQGGMTPAEMHALEQAAARDPFLAEALEGYESLPPENWSAPLAALHEQFAQAHPTLVVSLPRRRYLAPLRMAAGIGLLALTIAAAYLFTRREERSAPDLIAQHQPPTIAPTVPATGARPAVPAPEKPATMDTRPSVTVVGQTGTAGRNTPAAKPADDFVYRPHPAGATPGPPVTETNQLPTNDEKPAVAAAEETAALSEAMPAQVNAAYAPRNAVTSRSKKESNAGVTMAIPEASATKESAAPEGSANLPAAEPVIGWKAYETYLQTAKKSPASGAYPAGEVILELVFSADGQITRVLVIRSLQAEADAEALRLVKEGPAWRLRHKAPATLRLAIPF